MAKYLGVQVPTGANIFHKHEQILVSKLKSQVGLTNVRSSKLLRPVGYGSLIWKVYAILTALYAAELLFISTTLQTKLQKVH